MRKFFAATAILLGVVLGTTLVAHAATSIFQTFQGGTGTSTPSGILYGDNGATTHLNTVTIGAGCTFISGTLACAGTGGSGGSFPFTPTSYGVSTSTTIGFTNGFISTASSTVTGLLTLATTTVSVGVLTAPIIDSGGQYFNVKSCGATGNGITDDTADIQFCINLATNGGVVFFPPGQYKVTSTLTTNKSGLILEGDGNTTGKEDTVAATSSVIVASGFSTHTPILIMGHPGSTTQVTIGAGVMFLNFELGGLADGIYLFNDDQGLVQNVYVSNPWATGIFMGAPNSGGGVDNGRILNDKVANAKNNINLVEGQYLGGCGIEFGGGMYYGEIENSSAIVGQRDGICIGDATSSADTNKLLGNTGDGNAGDNYFIFGDGNVMTGNVSWSGPGKSALHLFSAGDSVITSNVFQGGNASGLNTGGAGSVIFNDSSRSVIFDNNQIGGEGHPAIGIYETGVNSGIPSRYDNNDFYGPFTATSSIVLSSNSISSYSNNNQSFLPSIFQYSTQSPFFTATLASASSTFAGKVGINAPLVPYPLTIQGGFPDYSIVTRSFGSLTAATSGIPTLQGTKTIALYIKPVGPFGGGSGVPITMGINDNSGATTYLNIVYDETNSDVYVSSGGTRVAQSANGSVPDGSWYEVAYSYDGTTNKLYINGSLASSSTTSLPSSGNPNILKFGSSVGGIGFFIGNIDSIRIWNTALTGTQVLNMYGNYASVPRTNIQGEWLFNEGAGTTAADSSGNNNTAVFFGDASSPSWSTDIPVQLQPNSVIEDQTAPGASTSTFRTYTSGQVDGGWFNATLSTSTFRGINLPYGGCFAIANTCIGTSGGSGTVTSVATTYPVTGGPFTNSGTIALAFGTTTANTWSQLQMFTGGLSSYASSTIGNNTQSGGLTINGGATTTGSSFLSGNVGIGVAADTNDSLYTNSNIRMNGAKLYLNGSGDNNHWLAYANPPDGPELTGFGGVALAYNGGTIGFVLKNTGNVGVASTTPWGTLTVQPPSASTVPQFVSWVQGSTSPSFLIGSAEQNGDVGIGTGVPTSMLQIAGTGQSPTVRINAQAPYNATTHALLTFGTEASLDQYTLSGNVFGGDSFSMSAGSDGSSNPFLSYSNSTLNLMNGSLYISGYSTGKIGIATTTPGTLLSLGVSGNASGINFSLSTSTFENAGGINLTTGCFSINNVCVGGSTGTSLGYTAWGGSIATTFGTTTVASTTPLWAQGGIFASSTSATPTLAVTQSGAGAAAIFTGGNVGIATTSPYTLLDIQSSKTGDDTPAFVIDGSATTNGNADLALTRATGGTGEANIDFNNGGTNVWQLGIQNTGADTGDFELWDGLNNPIFTIQRLSNNASFGTTTPAANDLVTFSTSTEPQFSLCDNSPNLCSDFRNVGNSFFLSTSSPFASNGATSSINLLSFNETTGALTLPENATTTAANGINLTGGCVTYNGGACIGGATVSGANPTASVGLTALNGSASTFMRSDAAPALNVGILPTWTGLHIFSAGASSTVFSDFGSLFVGGTATSTINGNGATSTLMSTLVIATSSPNAFRINDQYGTNDFNFSTASSTNNQPIFQVQATSTSNTLFQVDQYGHITASSTAPTPAISTCGTGSPAMGTNANDDVGSFVTGTSASACTITFGSPYSSTPVVVISDSNTSAVVDISAVSTTGFTISLASALSAVTVYYMVEMP